LKYFFSKNYFTKVCFPTKNVIAIYFFELLRSIPPTKSLSNKFPNNVFLVSWIASSLFTTVFHLRNHGSPCFFYGMLLCILETQSDVFILIS